MTGFVEGCDRSQSTLLPALLDDYVTADNPVRAIDVFLDGLDLGKLGLIRVQPLATGRPGYHPATMLKLYIYGYLNRVPSIRRLEPGMAHLILAVALDAACVRGPCDLTRRRPQLAGWMRCMCALPSMQATAKP